ncbi:MAG: hypothetical protein IK113_00205 [Bacteroidales bacterium]|nr:hypothetical protein [Bacteroidales bacterium]
MKRTLLWLAAAVAVVAACQKPENGGNGNDNTPTGGDKTFTATLAPLTKVTLGEDGLALSWTKADKVSIFDGKGNQMFRAQGSGASAEILGSAAQADTYYALYPYDASASLNGTVIQTTIAKEQTSSAGGVDLQVVAAGKSDGDKIALSPLAAILKFTLDNDAVNVSSVKIKTSEGALSGTVSIDCGGKPVLAAGSTASEVKVSASEGGFKSGGTYYVAVIPGTVGKITVTYTVGSDEMEVSAKGTTLAAGSVYELPNLTRAMTAEEKGLLGTWLLLKYGSRAADGTVGSYPWVNVERGFPNPAQTDGDNITFKSNGTVEMNLGPNNDTYNNTTYETQTVQMTGNERWTIVKKDGSSYLKFDGNAFPLMLADATGIGGEYLIVNVNENEMLLEYPYQGEEGPSVLGIYLTPKGKETYVHSFKDGDFGVTADGAEEVQPLVDQGITWEVSIDADVPFYLMNKNAGLTLGRAWVAGQNARSARMWSESFANKKIASVTVNTARFAPRDESTDAVLTDQDKARADLSVFVGGVKIGATYSIEPEMTPFTFTAPDPVGGLLEIKWEATNNEANCFWVKSVQVIYEE